MSTNTATSLPAQTAKIFEWLSKGLFINAHSANREQEELYKVTEVHFEALRLYFQHIDYQLERGQKYFYLSRAESKTLLEDKLAKLFRYLDALDFFVSFDPAFGVGSRFELEDILGKCKEDILLRRKLQQMDLRGEQMPEKIKRLADLMLRENFFELEDETLKRYRVLHAFHYLTELIRQIKIED